MTRATFFVCPMQSAVLFAPLVAELDALDAGVTPRCFDMVFSSRPERHAEWTLDAEASALERHRQDAGASALDLVGYSGGGAVCLAYAAFHPELVRSLCLVEPPWIGNDVWSDVEAAWRAEYASLAGVPDADVWDAVFALMNAPSARPAKPISEGAALRAGFLFVWRAYMAVPLDRGRLERLGAPVYLPVGGASAPRMHALATELARHLDRVEIEVLDGLGHFDIMTGGAPRLAAGLARTWELAAGSNT